METSKEKLHLHMAAILYLLTVFVLLIVVRCYAGDFNSPYSGQCSDLFPTNGRYAQIAASLPCH